MSNPLCFVVSHESWWFTLRWEELGGRPTARVGLYEDSWAMLGDEQGGKLFAWLATQHRQNPSPAAARLRGPHGAHRPGGPADVRALRPAAAAGWPMTTIAAVLLVPAEGDPLRLVREGEFGASPPTTWVGRSPQGEWGPTIHQMDRSPDRWHAGLQRSRRALVLAWNGREIAAGCDWAGRAGEFEPLDSPRMWVVDLLQNGRLDAGIWEGIGTIVLLDADGREVTP